MGGYIDSRTVLTLIAVLVVAGLVLLLIVAALLVRVRNDPKDVFGWGGLALIATTIALYFHEGDKSASPPVPGRYRLDYVGPRDTSLPRALVLTGSTVAVHDALPAYLAETGLFDVYLVDWTTQKTHRFVPKAGGECSIARARNRFFAMSGFTTCARPVEIDHVPEDALVLKRALIAAGDGSRRFTYPQLRDGGHEIGTRLTLTLRSGANERVLARREFVELPSPALDLVADATFEHRPVTVTDLTRTSPDDAAFGIEDFLFSALGIDEGAIRPPSFVLPQDLPRVVERLLSDPVLSPRIREGSISLLAAYYPTTEPVIAEALTEVVANDGGGGRPAEKNHVPFLFDGKDARTDCTFADRILRYRAAFAEGCRRVRVVGTRCIDFDASDWLDRCRWSGPIWYAPDPEASRIAVAVVASALPTRPSTDRAPLREVVEVRVPADRGKIDVAFYDTHLWRFTGAAGCIGRVTILGTKAGVVGLPRERVDFIGDRLDDYTREDPEAKKARKPGHLPARIRARFGDAHDVVVENHPGPILDLAEILPAKARKGRCDAGTLTPFLTQSPGEPVSIDPAEVVAVPSVFD